MKFLEQDLEEIIFNTDKELLMERGLFILPFYKLIRQCKIGNYGICDLISYYVDKFSSRPFIEITIYELKLKTINNDALMQAIRYARGVQRYLTKRTHIDFKINIILIGKKLDTKNDFIFLSDLIIDDDKYGGISSISMYTYKYDINGLYFDMQNSYRLINEGFGKLNNKNKK
jgi:hypothetical protein